MHLSSLFKTNLRHWRRLVKILGASILAGNGGNKYWKHMRFSIIGGTCPPKSTPLRGLLRGAPNLKWIGYTSVSSGLIFYTLTFDLFTSWFWWPDLITSRFWWPDYVSVLVTWPDYILVWERHRFMPCAVDTVRHNWSLRFEISSQPIWPAAALVKKPVPYALWKCVYCLRGWTLLGTFAW